MRTASSTPGMCTGPLADGTRGSVARQRASVARASAKPPSGGSGTAPSTNAATTNEAQAMSRDASQLNRRAAQAYAQQCSATAPVTWGGVGTDAQHAVFQLLHQGTEIVPVEFVASIAPAEMAKIRGLMSEPAVSTLPLNSAMVAGR